jgi:SPP1 gp7 family putative phage head morphogenesis protein
MPTSLAAPLGDRFLLHSINLLRFSANERRVILKMLKRLENDLVARLLATEGLTLAQTRRMEALFVASESIIQQSYKTVARQQQASLLDVAQYEVEQTTVLVNRTVGAPLMSVGVPEATLRALVADDIVLGLPAKDWWAAQAKQLKAAFQNTIRRGVFAGETLSELTRRVRGTRESGFTDGLMQTSTRNAEALIRTAVQSVTNAARYETLQANDGVIGGQQWLSTLDSRTTEICMALSGQAWDFEGNPIGDTTQPFPGPPPAHWGCRSTLIPVLKSWEQLIREAKGDEKLGRKLDRIESKIGKGTQASMDGQVVADMDYSSWLKMQSLETQREILGPARLDLWKNGKIGLTDLIDQRGQPRTIEQLKRAFTD